MANLLVDEAEQIAQKLRYVTPLDDQATEFLNSVYAAMPKDAMISLNIMTAYEKEGQWYEFPKSFWFQWGDGFDLVLKAVRRLNAQFIPYQPELEEPNSAFWACASRKSEIKEKKSARGSRNELKWVTTLWCDIDCAIEGYSLEFVLEKLLELPLKPTWIIFSGGGLHCVWVLSEAVDVSTAKLANEHKSLIMGFTKPIFDELNIKIDTKTAEPVRMLRLPGTVNRKYKREGAIARAIYFDPDCVYTLEQIQQQAQLQAKNLDVTQAAHSQQNAKVSNSEYGCYDKGAETLVEKWLTTLKKATEGSRHDTLIAAVSVVFRLVTASRADRSKIEGLFRSAARETGLEDWEIDRDFKSGWAYAEESPLESRPFRRTVAHVNPNAPAIEIGEAIPALGVDEDWEIDRDFKSDWAYAEESPLEARPTERTVAYVNPNAPAIEIGEAIPALGVDAEFPPLEREFVLDQAYSGARGMGKVLHSLLAGRVRYDNAEKAFYYWKGHTFVKDQTQLTSYFVGHAQSEFKNWSELIRAEADVVAQEVEAITKRIEVAVTDEERVAENALLDAANAFLTKLRNGVKALSRPIERLNEREGVRGTLAFLSETPEVATSGNDWDQRPYLLAVSNGVIDLKTGTLRNGHPNDMIRTAAPTTWEGLDAACPRFEQFLTEIFDGDQEMVDFLQRILGYALVGEVIFHRLVIMVGVGRNGKDTLLETLGAVLGDYATSVSKDVFIHKADGVAGRATPELIPTIGKRLIWGSENDEGVYLNSAQIKQITSGNTTPARALYGAEFRFKPTFLPVLATNFLPRLPSNDYAILKRLILIKFPLSFVDDPQQSHERKADPELNKTLLSEASGILAWLVRGCLEFQQTGLREPASVKAAARDYVESQDVFMQFILDMEFVQSIDLELPAGEAWKAWQSWCADQNRKPGQQKTFKERMKAHGFAHFRGTGGAQFYRGIGFRVDYTIFSDAQS